VDENALNLLAGAPVTSNLLADDLSNVGDLKEIAPGLPSDLLLRRPDILAAEHQLKAGQREYQCGARGVLPRVALTAAAGVTQATT